MLVHFIFDLFVMLRSLTVEHDLNIIDVGSIPTATTIMKHFGHIFFFC